MKSETIKQRIAVMGTAGQAAAMALLSTMLWLASLPIAITLSGFDGALAALFAAAAVWMASAMGLVIGEFCFGPSKSVSRLLAGMVIRMLLPLFACLIVLLSSQRLATSGFVFYVLAFYLVALLIETAMSFIKTTAPVCA
jgi:hypothetical protein